MELYQLVDEYFANGKVKVLAADFIICDMECDNDLAHISIELPRSLLNDYLAIKPSASALPQPKEFWDNSGILERLKYSNENYREQFGKKRDVLGSLGIDVYADFFNIESDPVILDITAKPKDYK
jgi:hypothetical protein